MSGDRARSVFVNCPFDGAYQGLFDALVFTINFCGFEVRSALEETSSGTIRLQKVLRLIKQSRFSIHDLSRTQLDADSGLPRFNMPLELGAAIGLYHTDRGVEDHDLLILDTEKHRYVRYVSDLAGVDIAGHGDRAGELIRAVRDFLNPFAADHPASPSVIQAAFGEFEVMLPELAAVRKQTVAELTYVDRIRHLSTFLGTSR